MSTPRVITLIFLSFVLFGCSVTTKPQSFDSKQSEPVSVEVYQDRFVTINGVKLNLGVANTLEKKIAGLSNRENMPQDAGMLFIFDKAEAYEFWMKDMKFALDFIWLSGDKIVDLHENITNPANTEEIPARVKPKEPVDSVIEVNAGWIKANNVKIGDIVAGL